MEFGAVCRMAILQTARWLANQVGQHDQHEGDTAQHQYGYTHVFCYARISVLYHFCNLLLMVMPEFLLIPPGLFLIFINTISDVLPAEQNLHAVKPVLPI